MVKKPQYGDRKYINFREVSPPSSVSELSKVERDKTKLKWKSYRTNHNYHIKVCLQ